MAIEGDISKAIDANLNAEVGTRLKVRLQQAEDLEKKNKLLDQEVIEARRTIGDLNSKLERAGDLDKKNEVLLKVQAEADKKLLRVEIVELKEKHAKERVDDMKELVRCVFANNQYKYLIQENGMGVVTANPNNYPATIPTTRTISGTGDGAPPPAPGQT